MLFLKLSVFIAYQLKYERMISLSQVDKDLNKDLNDLLI